MELFETFHISSKIAAYTTTIFFERILKMYTSNWQTLSKSSKETGKPLKKMKHISELDFLGFFISAIV